MEHYFWTLIYFVTYHISEVQVLICFSSCTHQPDSSSIEHYIDFTLFNYSLSLKGYAHIDTFTYVLTVHWIVLNIMITLSYIHYLINDHLSNYANIITIC